MNFKFFEMVERERKGVPVAEFVDAIQKIGLSKSRAAQIFKIPKSKLALKTSDHALLTRTEALAAIRLEKLCSMANALKSTSLHCDVKNFDSGRWLGTWIEIPQPALAGFKPSELLDTEAGAARVYQVLGALESDVYL